MKTYSVFPILFWFLPVTLGANILGVFSITSISHQIVYRRLMLELNQRGHNITVITPDPINDPKLKNYREIDVSFYYEIYNGELVVNPKELRIGLVLPELIFIYFTSTSMKMCRTYLSSPQVKSFIEENPKFDLLVTEFGFNPCFYGFAKLSGYKHVGMFSFQTNPIVHANMGNPTDASYIPDVNFPYFGKMNFFQRLRTVLFQMFLWPLYRYIMEVQTSIAREHFGNDLPHLVEIERNLSAMMVNTHFTLGGPRPYNPSMIEIGGPPFHLNERKTKPELPEIKKDQTCVVPGSSEKDLEELRIAQRDLEQRDRLRKKLEPRGFLPRSKMKTGRAWTEERKRKHSLRMREYWRKRKAEAGGTVDDVVQQVAEKRKKMR